MKEDSLGTMEDVQVGQEKFAHPYAILFVTDLEEKTFEIFEKKTKQ